MSIARQVRVHGRVQGVFFRDTCQSEAQAVGVTGWVSNEADGTVLAHFEGPEHEVDTMVQWCRSGSTSAQVRGVDVEQVDVAGFSDFQVR